MNINKIIDMHEDIMHSLISLNCEIVREERAATTGEERLRNDIMQTENICPMGSCKWNINGKCNQNGMLDLLKECRSASYKFYESDNSKKQVDSGYLGKV